MEESGQAVRYSELLFTNPDDESLRQRVPSTSRADYTFRKMVCQGAAQPIFLMCGTVQYRDKQATRIPARGRLLPLHRHSLPESFSGNRALERVADRIPADLGLTASTPAASGTPRELDIRRVAPGRVRVGVVKSGMTPSDPKRRRAAAGP